jgi:hypothetical protein
MTDYVYKFSANEVSIGTANSVWDSKVIRIVNGTGAPVTIEMGNSSVTNSVFTILANSSIIVEKTPVHLLTGTGCNAAPVAYR